MNASNTHILDTLMGITVFLGYPVGTDIQSRMPKPMISQTQIPLHHEYPQPVLWTSSQCTKMGRQLIGCGKTRLRGSETTVYVLSTDGEASSRLFLSLRSFGSSFCSLASV